MKEQLESQAIRQILGTFEIDLWLQIRKFLIGINCNHCMPLLCDVLYNVK